jgi:hypothetical protein
MSMKKIVSLGALVALLLVWPACKGATTPLAVANITLRAEKTMIYIGDIQAILATARMTDNTNQAVAGGTWATDNPAVATVDGSGVLTAVGSGMVNISVTFQGKTGTKQFRCLPNYGGTWTGTYTVTACSATGDFELYTFCGTLPSGTVLNTDLVLTQGGDQVTGQAYLGTLVANATGPVALNGQLALTAQVVQGDFTIDVVYTLQSTVPGQSTGDLTQLWLGLGATWMGQGQLTCAMNTLNRTSLMSREPGITGLASLPPNPTLQDIMNALRRR